MNNLTLAFERESGLVILEGGPAGVACEALLVPVPGLNLAFDRADGRLCRATVTTCGAAGPRTVSEQVAEMLARLFGAEAPRVVADVASSPWAASQTAPVLSSEPGLARTLSNLARLDAARATSPVPPDSPWWAAEAAGLAERAGLTVRARAEARRALGNLVGRLDSLNTAMLPEQAVRAARKAAVISAGTEPALAGRLWAAFGDVTGRWLGRSAPRISAPLPPPAFDVASEVESLENDRPRLSGLHWMLDPRWIPEGLFQAGLSPYSDLFVRHEGASGQVTAAARLAPGADCDALSGYQVRLVDPSIRRIVAQAGFTVTRSRACAELQPKFPLDELPESWVEVGPAAPWPVLSAKVRRIRRALRWADAALRAERTPAALAPASASKDWAALAAAAWERCFYDWAAAGDADRAYLAARRQAAIEPGTCVPRPPSAAAAEMADRVPIDGPDYLAEILGS
jgi:hypothetical protein